MLLNKLKLTPKITDKFQQDQNLTIQSKPLYCVYIIGITSLLESAV